jgi:hypothetical protein
MSQIPPPPGPPGQGPQHDYSRSAQDAVAAAKNAAQDALKVFMQLIYNPVGALPSAFASLSSSQALGVGIVFAVVFTLCLLLGGSGVLAMAGMPVGGFSQSLGFKGFSILLLTSLGFAAGIAGGNFLARTLFKGQGSIGFDVFSGGAALLPMGLGLLAASLLGMVGIGGVINSIPSMVGACLTVLVLFTGLTRVAQIEEGKASYFVGAILVIGATAAYLVARMCLKLFYGF